MRPDAKVEKVYLYPKPVDFRKSIDGLGALAELDIKLAVFDPGAFRLSQKAQQPGEGAVLGVQWRKLLESERFKTSPDATDEVIILSVQKLNWLLDGFDLWRDRPHQFWTPCYVA